MPWSRCPCPTKTWRLGKSRTARILHSQWVPGIEKTECNARGISPATVGGRTRFQSPTNKTWVEKGFFVLLLTWVSCSSKASGRHTWTNIWNVEVDGWKFQEPWVKEKATWLKFSDLKTIEIFPISAAQQPDWKTICSIQTGKTINSHGYLRKGKGGSWASAHLQPLAYSRCWCDEYCELINERGPAQPRSPCELPNVDHPHRPGSHQQSRCCCSNFQKLNLPTHIGQTSYLWRSVITALIDN